MVRAPLKPFEDFSGLPSMAAVLKLLDVGLYGTESQRIRCPVHQGKSRSASFYADDDVVYCFACGKTWNPLTLVEACLKVDRLTARQWLQARLPVVQLETSEQVKRVLERHAPLVVRQVTAQLEALDREVRARAPDRATAIRWWMAIDLLYDELETEPPLKVKARVQKLTHRMRGTDVEVCPRT